MTRLKFENDSDGKKYKVKIICDSVVYAKESDSSHYLPGFYYLVSYKGYTKEENTWKSILAVLHLRKLISTFYHDHLEKLIITSPLIDSASPMARPIVKPRAEALSIKQKQSKSAKDNYANKRVKKTEISSFLSRFWSCLNNRQNAPSVTWFSALLCSAPLNNLIFRFFRTSWLLPIFWFCFLGIVQAIFSTNHLDLSVFLYQSPRGLEVFHWLTHRFSSTISCKGFGGFLSIAISIKMFVRARVLERR